jgi:hypothetical protein
MDVAKYPGASQGALLFCTSRHPPFWSTPCPAGRSALDFIRESDTLVMTKLDRLARSTAHVLQVVETIEAKGVTLRMLNGAEPQRSCSFRRSRLLSLGLAQSPAPIHARDRLA